MIWVPSTSIVVLAIATYVQAKLASKCYTFYIVDDNMQYDINASKTTTKQVTRLPTSFTIMSYSYVSWCV